MKTILCFLIVLLFKNNINAQQLVPVTGTVYSAKEQKPLIGVTISVKGTNIHTFSSKEGNFFIKVPAQHILIISHVGYTTKEIKTDSIGPQPLNIILTENEIAINNVIVSTGYQQINKESATGSFEKIDNNLFNRSTGTSILSRIDGVAGSILFDHRQGSDASLQIRGISSIGYASTAPLIILDNFPYEGNINNISPNDVESITILKDAAAASIWGARAGNGVIVITTKKGQYNQPMKVSLNSNVIITAKPNLFTQKNMSTSDYIDLEKSLFDQGFYDYSIDNPYYFPPLSTVVQTLAEERDGKITEADATAKINELRTKDVRNDFEKYLYRPGVTQQYGINLSGGSEFFKYQLSGGYDRNLATLLRNQDDRFSIRSSNTYQPVKNLQLNVSLLYTKSTVNDNSPGGYNDLIMGATGGAFPPYTQFADAKGNPIPLDYVYSQAFTDTAGEGKLLDWTYNPLDELKNVSHSTITNTLIADIGLRYTFSKALNAEVKYQYQNVDGNSSIGYNVNSLNARNLINQFTQIDGANVTYIVPYGGILDAEENSLKAVGWRGQINFNKTIGTKHSINAIAGGEIRQNETDMSGDRTYGYDEKLNHTDVDFVNTYPTFDNVLGNIRIPSGSEFSSKLDRFVSMFANADYTYNKRYSISASFRKDASNLFGVDANKKGIPLWSVGGAWNTSEESFYHIEWLPFLKLRMTYGYGGNVSNSISALTTIKYLPASAQVQTNIPFNRISNYPNPNLQWEKVGMMNVGLDFGTRNKRLYGSVEYFKKKSSDLLGEEALDPTVGVAYLTTNSANLMGSGIDVNLNSINIATTTFQWESNFLFSSVKNKVTKYLYDVFTDGYVSDGQYINPIPGYKPYLIVSYKWGGLDSDGNPLGYLNGKKSNNYDSIMYYTPLKDESIGGSAIPQYFGSFRNTFLWKRFSISFNITYRLGYYFRKPTLSYYSLLYLGRSNSDYEKRWQNPGDENKTDVPAFHYPLNSGSDNFYQYADINVLKADNIKLNDLRVSYAFSSHINQKLSLQNLEIFGYLSNLNARLWIANKDAIDPDFPTGLKAPISISVGIKTDF